MKFETGIKLILRTIDGKGGLHFIQWLFPVLIWDRDGKYVIVNPEDDKVLAIVPSDAVSAILPIETTGPRANDDHPTH